MDTGAYTYPRSEALQSKGAEPDLKTQLFIFWPWIEGHMRDICRAVRMHRDDLSEVGDTDLNILITGASGGLGRALAIEYAENGVVLALLGRDSDRLEETARACRARGAEVETGCGDVRDTAATLAMINAFDDAHPVDIFVANAGVMHALRRTDLVEDPTQVRELFEVNMLAVTETVNPMLTRMAARGAGGIVIVSSMSAYFGVPTFPAYAASKAAVRTYYAALRAQARRRGVVVTVVCPSYINTSMTARMNVPRFMLTNASRAARTIKRAVGRRRRLVAFPWYHALGLHLLGILPAATADWIAGLVFRR